MDEVDTVYSEKGREMTVYSVAGSPLVLVAGDDEDRQTVVELLSELTGGIGILAGVTVVVQRLLGSSVSTSSRVYTGTPTELLSLGIVVFITGLACLLSLSATVAYRNGILSLPFVHTLIGGSKSSQ